MNMKNLKRNAIVAAIAVALLLTGFGLGALILQRRAPPEAGTGQARKQLWTCSMHPQVLQDKPGTCPICGMKLEPVRTQTSRPEAGKDETGKERKIKYWWDPMMKPPFISDKPGKSPMGMDLIPIYEDEAQATSTITIDPVLTQNMGIRTAAVEEAPLRLELRTVGYLREAENRQYDVALKVRGWVDRLHAHTEGMFVRKGDPLFELYSPELVTAQDELLIAQRAYDQMSSGAVREAYTDPKRLVQSSRVKLELWGVPEKTIEDIVRSGKSKRTLAFPSPADGFVVEKKIVEGSAVQAGEKTLRIVDQSVLWMDAQVYENRHPYLKLGQKAVAMVSGLPGRSFEGEVTFISPRVNPMTRTAVARLAFANPGFVLKPGMYAAVQLTLDVAPSAVLVPREAVIDTGVWQVAFVTQGKGRFDPRRVEMGLETEGGKVQILSGLVAGETVVTSGQFLLDAESRMREAIQKLTAPPKDEGPPANGRENGARAPAASKVDDVVKAYLEMSKSLASDREVKEGIRKALEDAAKALGAGDTEKSARDFPKSGLEDQRKAFEGLGKAVIALVEKDRPTKALAENLYVIHCPMKKADWLQTKKEVENPYFGKSMLTCGQVTRTIPLGGMR